MGLYATRTFALLHVRDRAQQRAAATMPRMKRILAALAALTMSLAAHAAPWWSAFGEPALDGVMQAAGDVDDTAQLALVQSWIVARVQQSRLTLVRQLLQAARAEQALLMNAEPGPARDPALAAVGQRIEQAEAALDQLVSERNQHLLAMAATAHLDPNELAKRLAGTSGPAVPLVAAPAPGADDNGPTLAALAREAARLQQLQRARELEFQARQARERAGDSNQVATLQTWQQLMLDTDRTTVAAGKLALAWAQWLPARQR